MKATSFKKTGTTIVGVKYADGIVLAADTRATAGSIVADKNCAKLHPMAPNIYAAGAGTAADCDHVSGKYNHFCNKLRAKFLEKSLNQKY